MTLRTPPPSYRLAETSYGQLDVDERGECFICTESLKPDDALLTTGCGCVGVSSAHSICLLRAAQYRASEGDLIMQCFNNAHTVDVAPFEEDIFPDVFHDAQEFLLGETQPSNEENPKEAARRQMYDWFGRSSDEIRPWIRRAIRNVEDHFGEPHKWPREWVVEKEIARLEGPCPDTSRDFRQYGHTPEEFLESEGTERFLTPPQFPSKGASS